MIIGKAEEKLMAPVLDKACKIPTDAEEDCMMAVTIAPRAIPSIGLLKIVKSLVKDGLCRSALTEELIVLIPYINTVNPSKTKAIERLRSFFDVTSKSTPINASRGVKFEGCSIRIKMESPVSVVKLRIQGVIVVPIFAPIIKGTA